MGSGSLDLEALIRAQGRYLPLFASAVYDQNARLVKDGREPINLKSVMIGNGFTSRCEPILLSVARGKTE